MATLKPACSFVKRMPAVPIACRPEEAAHGHERERQEQHARVAAAVRLLSGRVAEHEREPTDDPEDDEVGPVVLEVRVELLPQEERDEPDERQRRREHPGGYYRSRSRAVLRRHHTSVGLTRTSRVGARTIPRPPRGRSSKARRPALKPFASEP